MAYDAQHQIVQKDGFFIQEAKKHARATSPLTSLQFALTFFGVFGTVAVTFWYGTLIFTKNRLDNVGVIIVVLLSLTTIFFSLDRVSPPMQAIGKATLAACEFFSVIDTAPPERGSLREPEVSATRDIIFDKVTFAYPSRPDLKILDQLDLRIKARKITAVVSPSGSGKSTIVALIELWYTRSQQNVIAKATQKNNNQKKNNVQGSNDSDVELSTVELPETKTAVELQGTIRTRGCSLDDIDVKWWRSQVGLVQQEPFLFNDTIYGNVAHGLIGSPWEGASQEQKRHLVKDACREAFADEFIEKLPQAYDTNVGDGGARLSGGQRQRMAIARSIIKKPSILILDEATSAIDVRGERIVQAALDKAAKGRTTIVIAHRLATVKNADRIIVLKKGIVVESGTHEGLIAINDGVYAGLVKAQALSLGDPAQGEVDDDFEAAGLSSLISEQTRAGSEYGDNLSDIYKTEGGKSRGFFTILPLYAWLFSKSIDLFKYQENHSRLMDEVDFMAGRVASFIRAKYQMHYFESRIFQPAACFDEDGHSQGTLSSRVRDDPLKLEEMVGTNIAQVCIAVSNIIGGIAMAFSYSWKLTLVSICAVVPVCIFSGYIRFRYELLFEKMNDEVFAESSKFASEAIGACRTVASLTLEETILTRFEKLCRDHVHAAYKMARWVSIVLGFSDSATLACQALIFYYGGRLLVRGEIGIMGFFVCLMAMMNAAEGFGQSLSFGPNVAQATAASNRILDARSSRLLEKTGEDDIPNAAGAPILSRTRTCSLPRNNSRKYSS
ncbi:P-loop containing nucleoside triphosphate hydrolase protein [Pleurostoma richardsiae]|uniref:P-loop containing nucleoside triphosphate hydrolase protein n=1 Tax=Pleurostoma richardsiae TaxID=41990 RepID=A0AA38R463_9PEZI|nr:P-loop containing nucleoside triphosphate hydrolase protein [Pleurostoma richardsiae]